MKGNRFLLSNFDGFSLERDWERRLEALFPLHPLVEREAIEIATLHMMLSPYINSVVPYYVSVAPLIVIVVPLLLCP